MSFFHQKSSKQTSKLRSKQLETIHDNIILVSESLLTDIKMENEAHSDHLWSHHFCVRKCPNRQRNRKGGNYRPFIITSYLCQKASKQALEMKTKQLETIDDNIILVSETLQTESKLKTKLEQTIYDNMILVWESLKKDIEIENEAITDHLWKRHSCVRKTPNRHQNWNRSN